MSVDSTSEVVDFNSENDADKDNGDNSRSGNASAVQSNLIDGTYFSNESLSELIKYLSNLVCSWDQLAISRMVRSYIPEERIRSDVATTVCRWENDNKKKCTSYTYYTIYLQKLVDWFRTFFHWMRTPFCMRCKNKMAFREKIHSVLSTVSSLVEIYVCSICQRKEFINRFVDPHVLLRTREGRCSEYSILFTVFCNSINLRARYIYDFSDHCWTEVYHPMTKKWIHVDPSEGIVDQPLMYEVGWGKCLSYILAFSSTDIQDVTWRYSCNHLQIIARRSSKNQCHLIREIVFQRNNLLKDSPHRLEELKMVLTELASLMISPIPNKAYPSQDLTKYDTPPCLESTDKSK